MDVRGAASDRTTAFAVVAPLAACLFLLLPAHARADETPAVAVVEPDLAEPADEPAELTPPAETSAPRIKSVQAMRAGKSPKIDGKLTDAIWTRAAFVSDFVQRSPVEGAQPFRRTEVAFAYDNENIYIGARMLSNGPDDIAATLTRRDDPGGAERLVVSIDTLGDHRTAYTFAVTAAGVRLDWYHPDERSRDFSYNPVWRAETEIDATGWQAEMRIPLSQLRFPESEDLEWRVNLVRVRPQDNEESFWMPVPKDQPGWSAWFGDVAGVTQVPTPVRAEFVPYLAANAAFTSAQLVDPTDPFGKTRELTFRAGLDAKVGLGAASTLDLTILPDFGQIEADPAVVNLTDFEVFLEERRPFFVEGNRLLEGAGPYYYFSRRIGAKPRGSTTGDFRDAPQVVPLLGAAKLVTRIGDGVTLGGLAAITGPAYARTYSQETQTFEDVSLEPLTSYNVLRLEKQFAASRNVFGVMGTAMIRHLPSDVRLASELSQRAFTGGGDFTLHFGGNDYELKGDLGMSIVSGEADAIARIQRSSTHYFQRPDQPHVSFDPNRTSLFGWRSNLRLNKNSGKWQGSAGTSWESPGFDLNDMGRLPSADDGEMFLQVQYIESAGKRLQAWEVGSSVLQQTNFGLVRAPTDIEAWAEVTFRNFWRAELRASYSTPGYDHDATRGGPLVALDSGYGGRATLGGSFGKVEWGASGRYVLTATGTTGFATEVGIGFRPFARMQLSLSPRYTNDTNTRQYVTTVDNGRPETYDMRYIFATVQRNELAVQGRMQLSLTPSLSIELYAEPFASSGRFSDFGEVYMPRSSQLLRYGAVTPSPEGDLMVDALDGRQAFTIRNPDFTQLSLRSTAVLRWEFLPGSDFTLIYQQRQDTRLPNGELLDASDLKDTFAAAGTHSVGLKFTYWWSVN